MGRAGLTGAMFIPCISTDYLATDGACMHCIDHSRVDARRAVLWRMLESATFRVSRHNNGSRRSAQGMP